MARVTQRGIDAALPFAGPTVFHTGNAAPPTTTTGTDVTPVVTEEYVAEVFVPMNCLCTGVAILNGSAVAGNVQLALYDSNGAQITTTASTAQAGTAAYQKVPWSAVQNLKGPAKYFIGLQHNNTGNRFRAQIPTARGLPCRCWSRSPLQGRANARYGGRGSGKSRTSSRPDGRGSPGRARACSRSASARCRSR
jgi:hypothetical protein